MPKETDSLEHWIAWLERLDPSRIELGLTRVKRVLADLVPDFGRGICSVLVAGTNGKGSTATLIERLAHAAGQRTALYTSPHFFRFTERLRFDGAEVQPDDLVRALARVEAARGDTELTYFEFTTLAAFWLIQNKRPDIMVLEIGLGGRLDAVNAAPSDCSVVTTIGLDHTAWLGDTLEAIAREKAGVARAGKPFIIGAKVCADVFAEVARSTGARLIRVAPDTPLSWKNHALPQPGLPEHSARLALSVLECLGIEPSLDAVRRVLQETGMPGRLQRVTRGGRNWLFDVAHNPQAAAWLAAQLAADGPWSIVLGQLEDKDVAAVVQSLAPLTAGQPGAWFLAGLPGSPRGLSARQLQQRGGAVLAEAGLFPDVRAAMTAARERPGPILVCGSFYTVSEGLAVLGESVA